VLDGFLPPENGFGSGQGFVTYRIRPNSSLTTGTAIDAKARVIFEAGLPDESFLDTPQFTNTIDTSNPTSSVTALAANSLATFTVNWSGSDDAGGSGIVTIVKTGPRWRNTAKPNDVDGDGFVSPIDVLQIINELNDPKIATAGGRLPVSGPKFPPPFLDVNDDGFVSPLDALIVINFLNDPTSGEGEAVRHRLDDTFSVAGWLPILVGSHRVESSRMEASKPRHAVEEKARFNGLPSLPSDKWEPRLARPRSLELDRAGAREVTRLQSELVDQFFSQHEDNQVALR
jgi:hypothetical protein